LTLTYCVTRGSWSQQSLSDEGASLLINKFTSVASAGCCQRAWACVLASHTHNQVDGSVRVHGRWLVAHHHEGPFGDHAVMVCPRAGSHRAVSAAQTRGSSVQRRPVRLRRRVADLCRRCADMYVCVCVWSSSPPIPVPCPHTLTHPQAHPARAGPISPSPDIIVQLSQANNATERTSNHH
jgi:hypothetical protein